VRYSTLEMVLDEQLREIFVGELHIARHLPRLVVDVSSSELKSQIGKALEQCHVRIERLERLLKTRNLMVETAQSRVVDTLTKQASEVVQHRGDDLLLDYGLVVILRHLESYQKSVYESAREVANGLSVTDVAATLELDLEDHGRMERYFTVLEEDMLDSIVARRGTNDKTRHPWEATTR
jgi:ferritin-like metal-binding protein YciE